MQIYGAGRSIGNRYMRAVLTGTMNIYLYPVLQSGAKISIKKDLRESKADEWIISYRLPKVLSSTSLQNGLFCA